MNSDCCSNRTCGSPYCLLRLLRLWVKIQDASVDRKGSLRAMPLPWLDLPRRFTPHHIGLRQGHGPSLLFGGRKRPRSARYCRAWHARLIFFILLTGSLRKWHRLLAASTSAAAPPTCPQCCGAAGGMATWAVGPTWRASPSPARPAAGARPFAPVWRPQASAFCKKLPRLVRSWTSGVSRLFLHSSSRHGAIQAAGGGV